MWKMSEKYTYSTDFSPQSYTPNGSLAITRPPWLIFSLVINIIEFWYRWPNSYAAARAIQLSKQ